MAAEAGPLDSHVPNELEIFNEERVRDDPKPLVQTRAKNIKKCRRLVTTLDSNLEPLSFEDPNPQSGAMTT